MKTGLQANSLICQDTNFCKIIIFIYEMLRWMRPVFFIIYHVGVQQDSLYKKNLMKFKIIRNFSLKSFIRVLIFLIKAY